MSMEGLWPMIWLSSQFVNAISQLLPNESLPNNSDKIFHISSLSIEVKISKMHQVE